MKTRTIYCLGAAALCLGAAAMIRVASVHAQDPVETLNVDDVTRSFTVHLPNGYDKAKKYPVVMVLHGFDQDGDDIARIAHFNTFADTNGIVAVYPNALGRKWDLGVVTEERPQHNGFGGRHGGWGGGGPMGGGPPYGGGGGGGGRHGGYGRQDETPKANDLAYFDALLDKVESEYSVDASRVYATGLSGGGFMVYRLACMMSERLAAIAPVAATFPEELSKECGPAHPMPVMMITGTSDPVVKYQGNSHPRPPVVPSISAQDSTKTWLKLNSCDAKDNSTTLPAKTSGGMQTKIDDYTDCQQNADVALYSVVGGGNTWPGGEQYEPEKQVGKTSADFDADDVIWKFLSAHKLASAPSSSASQR
jgi:polyhydroxybutyrate depolymerase